MRGSKVTGKGELRLSRPSSRGRYELRHEGPNGTIYEYYREQLEAELKLKEYRKSSEKHPVYLQILPRVTG